MKTFYFSWHKYQILNEHFRNYLLYQLSYSSSVATMKAEGPYHLRKSLPLPSKKWNMKMEPFNIVFSFKSNLLSLFSFSTKTKRMHDSKFQAWRISIKMPALVYVVDCQQLHPFFLPESPLFIFKKHKSKSNHEKSNVLLFSSNFLTFQLSKTTLKLLVC